jgi:hypothetical protein
MELERYSLLNDKPFTIQKRKTMKKLFFSIMMIFAAALTACSSQSTGTPSVSTNNDLPTETQIAVGTLKLAGTDQEISIEQAEELVVYWQVYQELSQSQTAAQAEIDGLIAQIQETMTGDQMQAITEMNITQQDVLASMQGVTVASSSSSSSTVSLPSGSASGGGMPAGGPPEAGAVPPDGGAMPSEMGGVALASGPNQTQSSQAGTSSTVITEVPSALVDAVIQSLQQKIAA